MEIVFSKGELHVQKLAGEDKIAQTRIPALNNRLDNFSARFIQSQLVFNITSIDEKDRVWISILTGKPHFIEIINAFNIRINKDLIISPHEDIFHRNIKFNFENCCLATNITGNGKIKRYEKILKVKIKKGKIKINPEFDHTKYTAGDIYMSLGKYVNREKGKWTVFNNSQKKTLNLTIDSINDSIDLSGMIFEIPYSKNSELENSWIVITTTDETRRRTNYSHSKEKTQTFTK